MTLVLPQITGFEFYTARSTSGNKDVFRVALTITLTMGLTSSVLEVVAVFNSTSLAVLAVVGLLYVYRRLGHNGYKIKDGEVGTNDECTVLNCNLMSLSKFRLALVS